MDSTMRSLIVVFLLFLIIACSTEIEEPELIPSLPDTAQKECNPKDICCYDLSEKRGVYDLFTQWEFVVFQKSKDNYFDNLTCLARTAEFALGGEDYDNVFQVTLKLSKKSSTINSCSPLADFTFRSFNHEILGCYEVSPEGMLKFNFTEETITFSPSRATHTFPMLEFEKKIKESLAAVETYQIDQNKLYLGIKGQSEKMVFIAIEE